MILLIIIITAISLLIMLYAILKAKTNFGLGDWTDSITDDDINNQLHIK